MQSVHGADRLPTAVHLLIKHTTERLIRLLHTRFASNFALRPIRSIQFTIYIYVYILVDRTSKSIQSFDSIFSLSLSFSWKQNVSSSFEKTLVYPEFTAASIVQFQQVSLDGGPPLTGTPNNSVTRWWLPGDCHAVVLRAALFRYQYRRSRG